MSESGQHVAFTVLEAARFRMKLKGLALDELTLRTERFCDVCDARDSVEMKPKQPMSKLLGDFAAQRS